MNDGIPGLINLCQRRRQCLERSSEPIDVHFSWLYPQNRDFDLVMGPASCIYVAITEVRSGYPLSRQIDMAEGNVKIHIAEPRQLLRVLDGSSTILGAASATHSLVSTLVDDGSQLGLN